MELDPVTFATCNEKGKWATRKVYPFICTIENLQRLWEVARVHPTLFGIAATKDFGEFCNVFVHYDENKKVYGNGLMWLVDDYVGLFYMNEIFAPDDALVHFSFFDRRMRGREPLVKAMVKYVFEKYGFHRLSAQIPMFALPRGYREECLRTGKSPTEAGIFGFIKACGFKQEGRKRSCVSYKDERFDLMLYGILREEALNGR